jgi:glycosyltransferase involved in cell wall biosynthesis
VKISYVNGICLSNDAISNSVRDEVTWLKDEHDVKLYVYACDNAALPAQIVRGVQDIAFDPHFQSSDLVIFHFGVYYPLFDLLTVAPRHARRIAVFHNITPKQFVAPSSHELIEKSFRQMSNMVFADHIVCVSQTNLDVLRQAGIRVAATVLPLALHTQLTPPQDKPSFQDEVLRFAFLGRLVRSKGPTELLEALAQVMRLRPALRAQLDLIGNLSFSDQLIIAEINAMIGRMGAEFGSRLQIDLRGNASEQEKLRCLAQADVFVLPSYHEGFCVPILEALASGCRVVAYDNSNIPHIAGGFAALVPTGDKEKLAGAILETADACGTTAWRMGGGDDSYCAFTAKTAGYVAQFAPPVARQRFLRLIRRVTPLSARNY